MKDIDRLCMGCMNETDGDGICPFCGYDKTGIRDINYLIPGTKIMKRFLVGKVTETNGEGVTYICYDAKTDKTVSLREYFPIGLCERGKNGSVRPNAENIEIFSKGLRKFTTLCKKLADHPEITSVPDVVEFFEGNGTAYCIYESFPSITLREFLLRNGGTLNWEQTATIFMPLLSTVRALHDIGVLHRGISPETIFIGRDGKVRLGGFCIEDVRTMGTAFTPQIFPGFAPIEQYGSIGEQGTWTDVYSLAATIYRVLVGNPPAEANERVTNDTLTIPTKVTEECPKALVEALADALQIIPEERTGSIEQFKAVLSVAVGKAKKLGTKKEKKGKYRSYMLLATIITILLITAISALIYVFVILPGMDDDIPEISSNIPTSSYMSNDQSTSSATTGTVEVDNFLNMTYQDVINNTDFSQYNFVIEAKKYSSSYSARKIMEQSPQPGEKTDPDENGKITIYVVVSLGDYYISMPDVTGMSEQEALLTLLKAGFQLDNIGAPIEKYDPNATPDCVIETSPAPGESVNLDSTIEITINTFKPQVSEPLPE